MQRRGDQFHLLRMDRFSFRPTYSSERFRTVDVSVELAPTKFGSVARVNGSVDG